MNGVIFEVVSQSGGGVKRNFVGGGAEAKSERSERGQA